MKKMHAKVISVLVSLLMVFTLLPMAAFADGAVATIGTTGYDTLQKAVAAAVEGDTITLLSDITLNDASDKMSINKSVTIQASSPVTITNGVVDAFTVTSGTLTLGSNVTVNSNTAILYANGGNIVIDGAVLNAVGSPYATAFVDEGTITVNSGEVSNNGGTNPQKQHAISATGTGVINVNGGTVTVDDGSAMAAFNGGVINITGGIVKTTDPSTNPISYCSVWASNGGVINVSGGTVSSDKYYSVVAAVGGKVNVSGGTVNGGVLAHGKATETVTGGTATVTGGLINGGVKAEDDGTTAVSGGDFSDNPAAYVVAGYCVGNSKVSGYTYTVGKHNSDVTIPGKAPTCYLNGATEGKQCSVCGTVTVAQQLIGNTGHYDGCGHNTGATSSATSPKTGDSSAVLLCTGLAVLSALGFVVLSAKKRED